jgi:hypothetical protein
MVFCPVIIVVMLESRVARCVHCDEDVACNILVTVIVKNLHETYQRRMYSRKLLMMGKEDARNT